MNDRILEGYVKDFVKEFDLDKVTPSEAFEHFVNYCVISKFHPDHFDFEDISVGGGNDIAIDGVAVLVNDHLVSSKEDIEYFKKALNRIDAQFIFIQAKTSDKFDMGDIGNFLFGVRQFFQSSFAVPTNDAIKNSHALKEYIYDRSIEIRNNPICRMYYVTTGSWKNDATLVGRIESEKAALKQTGLFAEVEFVAVDAERLKSIYRELRLKVVKEIDFERHTILPKIETVQEAYIGIIPCQEYIKLICDEDGNLQRNLFYDNVRDYQGDNPVNQEIRETITVDMQKDRFVLLNNGITIVAKSINKIGTTFKIMDYQIVNGCQTSHVLYYNRAGLTKNMYVPIKLIVTDNAEVMNLVTKATNSQTEVKREAFESLSPFHKRLEEYYVALNKDRDIKIYYERRSKQYESQQVNRNYIVTLAKQINCFIAMFLDTPQSTHRYYGELLDSYKERIFLEQHALSPYFISGLAICRVEEFIRAQSIEARHKRFKYHMIMLLRILTAGTDVPKADNLRRMEAYCAKILDVLYDQNQTLHYLNEATGIIDLALSKTNRQELYETPRRRDFTMELLSSIASYKSGARIVVQAPPVSNIPRETGIAFSWSGSTGLIRKDNGEKILVYPENIVGGNGQLRVGSRYKFSVTEDTRGKYAIDITQVE